MWLYHTPEKPSDIVKRASRLREKRLKHYQGGKVQGNPGGVRGGATSSWITKQGQGLNRMLKTQRREGTDAGKAQSVKRRFSERFQEDVESILAKCEEHTSWVNDLLKQHGHRAMVDLRKNISDGKTLVQLLEILSQEKIPGVHSQPQQWHEKVENIQASLRHLEKNGMNTQGLMAEELADGNLKSTIQLMNGLRSHYDSVINTQREHATKKEVNQTMAATSHSTTRGPQKQYHLGNNANHHPFSQVRNGDQPTQHHAASTSQIPGSIESDDWSQRSPSNSGAQVPVKETVSRSQGAGLPERPPFMSRLQAGDGHTQPYQPSFHYTPASNRTGAGINSAPGGGPPITTHPNMVQAAPSNNVASQPNGDQRSGNNKFGQLNGGHQDFLRKDVQLSSQRFMNHTPPVHEVQENNTPQRSPHSQGHSYPSPANRTNQQSQIGCQQNQQPHQVRSNHYRTGDNQSTLGPTHFQREQIYQSPTQVRKAPPPYPTDRTNAELGRQTPQPQTSNSIPALQSGPSRPLSAGRQAPQSARQALQSGRQTPQPQVVTPRHNPQPQYWRSTPQSEASRQPEFVQPSPAVSDPYGSNRRTGLAAYSRHIQHPNRLKPAASADVTRTNATSPSHLNSSFSHKPSVPDRPVRHEWSVRAMASPSEKQHSHSAASMSSHTETLHKETEKPVGKTGYSGKESPHVSRHVNNNAGPVTQNQRRFETDSAAGIERPSSAGSLYNSNRDRPGSAGRLYNGDRGNTETNPGNQQLAKDSKPVPRDAGTNSTGNLGSNFKGSSSHNHSTDIGAHTGSSQRQTDADSGNKSVPSRPISWNRGDELYDDYDESPSSIVHMAAQSISAPTLDLEAWKKIPYRGDLEDCASDSSERSVTPPLPPLSPSNTPPLTPPGSPFTGRRVKSYPACNSGALPESTPDVVTSTAKKGQHLPVGRRKPGKRGTLGYPGVKTKRTGPGRMSLMKSLPGTRTSKALERHGEEDISQDETETDQEPPSHAHAGQPGRGADANRQEMNMMRQQMDDLEGMYTQMMQVLGISNEHMPGSRRSISSTSSISGRRSKFKRSHSSKDPRHWNRRFSRLESHVVTLARSVAHLSSEMKSQNVLFQEMDEVKRSIKELQEDRARRRHHGTGDHPEWERFRGWVPSLTNPKRVNKLTRFFGQEPPLLHIFLKKLGYDKYIPHFEKEKIGMIELPYMTEERLSKIGIPMGPRLRILQEAQMCFRQENFNIYIV